MTEQSLFTSEESIAESADGSSRFDGSSSGADLSKQKVDREHEKALAHPETRTIYRLKLILVFVLIAVALGVALYAHQYALDVQEDELFNTFESHGTKLTRGFYEDSFQKLQAMESLSTSITYLFRNETWPFVTIPDSANFFRAFLSLSSTGSIKFTPIVGDRQRLQWEAHVLDQKDWIQEAIGEDVEDHSPPMDVQSDTRTDAPTDTPSSLPTSTSTKPTFMTNSSLNLALPPTEGPTIPSTVPNNSTRRRTQYFEIDETVRVSPYIKSYVGVDTSPGVWAPIWQYFPVVPNNNYFINFNQLVDGEFKRNFPILTDKKKAVIAKTEFYQQGLDSQSTRDLEFTQDQLRIGGYGNYEPGEPIGFLHYPVFQSTLSRDNKVVAILTATLYWKSYFQNVLPDTARGVICVIENGEQQFTYKIDGKDAIFLGHGDLHDSRFDDFEIGAGYQAFQDFDGSGEGASFNRIYSGVPVDESRLRYKIRVYPSQEMADIYLTDAPVYYAVVVAAVLLIGVMIFAVYDWYVEMRQHQVSTVALQSNAIVSSLFPKQVKDKLYGETTRPISKKDAFLRPGKPVSLRSSGSNLELSERITDESKTTQIADFFPSATVLFMDIAGFTAWSSSREPCQVFTLLEAIFGTFDKLALRRRVFKVETIGDCYLAVCGLPEPCEKHALNMASFARDCLEKTNVIAHQLIPTLGPETGELTVRIGMHSGPVTAGVLRGDRARFQLFGDTVNTSSRMESTGKAGYIQCSQDCAEQLRLWGKESWLRKRRDEIQAKGKGTMQTFWIKPKGATTLESGSGSIGSTGPDGGMDVGTKTNES